MMCVRAKSIELFGRKGLQVENICEQSERLTSWGSILAYFLSIYVSPEVQLMILSVSLLGIHKLVYQACRGTGLNDSRQWKGHEFSLLVWNACTDEHIGQAADGSVV
jgi:hypothetical protein